DMWEDEETYDNWERYHWSAKDCRSITEEKWKEAQRLPEDIFTIFWEGKPYARKGALVPTGEIKQCVKDVPKFIPEADKEVIAGLDWGWCLSADTELLTKEGWVPLSSIEEGTEVLCMDPNLKVTIYLPVTSISIKEYEGRMVHLKSRNLDVLAKPSHIIPYLDRNRKNLHVHYAGEHVTHHILIRKARYQGNKPEYFMIPGVASKRTDLKLDKPLKIPIIPFLRFLGWYLSEGNVDKHRIVIHQDREVHPRYYQEIVEIVKDMGLHPIPIDNRIIIGKSREKYIPLEVKLLDGRLLIHLLETLLKGDGDKYFARYNTYSRQLAEDVQEIACKTGKYHAYIVNRGTRGYRVNLLTRDSMPNKTHYHDILWRGRIAMFRVPSRIVLTRRNGKVSYQHNRHATALVVVQKSADLVKILYCDAWYREQFEDLHDRIVQIAKDYKITKIYADAEDIGENQRLEAKGLNIVPVAFNQNKVQMQSHLKMMFHQGKIRIPEEYVELIRQLRKYNWDTKEDDDLVIALMLALKGVEEDEESYYYEII
ncbi:MAG: phage terminase large subunit family protein, partial [Candidatus Thorarchaeota archaeon]